MPDNKNGSAKKNKDRLNKNESSNDSSRINEQIQTNKPKNKPVIRKKPKPVQETQDTAASRETNNRIDAIKRKRK
ncbi:hypothetical protein AVK61_14935 [Staphylococcus aureus]|uniref:hypothetical protein n=1 Tax=Staphylococcus aureus TaxID=1280 RepID=UPI000BA5CA62|nr:hypothetical protein [Staphylococcus aureus]PAG17454.1 hypothetical protein AVK61_14935 [Staphylococcus aureus]